MQSAAVCYTVTHCNRVLMKISTYPMNQQRTHCSVLQCVAVCCSVLQRVAVYARRVAVCCSVMHCAPVCCSMCQVTRMETRYDTHYNQQHSYVLQRVAACCSVLQCVAVSYPINQQPSYLAPEGNVYINIHMHLNAYICLYICMYV